MRAIFLNLLLLLACVASAEAQWEVVSMPADHAGAGCLLQSALKKTPDGYQTTSLRIEIDNTALRVQSESCLDESFKDISLQVDAQPLVKMDRIETTKTAVYEKHYVSILDALRRGSSLRVQMRYWPTWPTTGVHSLKFSLKGFSKAYDEFLKCKK